MPRNIILTGPRNIKGFSIQWRAHSLVHLRSLPREASIAVDGALFQEPQHHSPHVPADAAASCGLFLWHTGVMDLSAVPWLDFFGPLLVIQLMGLILFIITSSDAISGGRRRIHSPRPSATSQR